MNKIDDTDHPKPVTMRTVAEVAGVSMTTVSRVLNGSGPVNAQVAERVRTVMVPTGRTEKQSVPAKSARSFVVTKEGTLEAL